MDSSETVGGHEQLISNGGRIKPAFAKREKKQTMIDLRGILTNWFKNQLWPTIRLFRLRAPAYLLLNTHNEHYLNKLHKNFNTVCTKRSIYTVCLSLYILYNSRQRQFSVYTIHTLLYYSLGSETVSSHRRKGAARYYIINLVWLSQWGRGGYFTWFKWRLLAFSALVQ